MLGAGLRDLAVRVLAVSREKHVTAAAASIAYYAFNSLVPLLLVLFAALTAYGPVQAVLPAVELLTGVSVVEFRAIVERLGARTSGRLQAVSLAVAILAWSSLRLFRGVDSVFSQVYGTRKERTTLRRFLDSTLVLLTVSLGVAVMAVVGVALSFRVRGFLWSVAGPLLVWLSLWLLFVPMYYLFPGEAVSVRESLPGAALAAGGWTVSLLVVRVYLGVSRSVQLYGVAGAVLLVLSWLYVGSTTLLLGVVLNAVLAGRVEVDPDWLPGDRERADRDGEGGDADDADAPETE